MFSLFRKKPSPPAAALPGAEQLSSDALMHSVLGVFSGQHSTVGALFLVAWEVVNPSYFPSFYKAMQEEHLFPATYEGMSSFWAAEHAKRLTSSLEDEIAQRRLFYLYIACLFKVAHARAEHEPRLWDGIADIWLALLPGARALRATLDRTSLWEARDITFFDHVKTEDEGERYLLRTLMPARLRSHAKIVAWEERDLTEEDRASIAEAMQLLRGDLPKGAPSQVSASSEAAARLIASQAAWGHDYKEQLVAGVEVEHGRLGTQPYLVVLNGQGFDYDGLTESVRLLDSHASQAEAEESAKLHARREVAAQLAVESSASRRWHVESEEPSPYILEPRAGTEVRTLLRCSAKLRASDYDTMYITVRVVGPFRSGPIDAQLVDFLGATELKRYFVEVGKRGQARDA